MKQKSNKVIDKKHFYQKKPFRIITLSALGVIFLALVISLISPVPGALLIRSAFSKNTTEILSKLEKHKPSVPITSIYNQQYRDKDGDAMLDVHYPTNIKKGEKLPLIIWTHGGAWISGDKDNATPYYKLLAAEGFTVIGVDYSLAPEHTYPTAVHQLNDAYSYITANDERFHVDANNIILAGDSAGAQLSSQMGAIITSPEYAQSVGIWPSLKPSQLKGLVLNCGIYMMDGLTQPDPTLPKLIGWGDDVSVWAYSNTKDFTNPIIKEMSAYYHVTKDYPPTYISGGNGDPLTNAQARPFAKLLTSIGVDVTTLFFDNNRQPALPHEYQFNLDNEAGQTALRKTAEFAHKQTR